MSCAWGPLFASVLALVSAGCVLPVATATPQPATTSGKGNVTFGARLEAPTIDLLETAEDSNREYDVTPFPVISPELAFGIHEYVDLEVAVDWTLFFVLPLPTGINGGLRMQVIRNHAIALALAGRIGVAGVATEINSGDGSEGSSDSLSAVYGWGGFSLQANPYGRVRPGLSANYWHARIRENDDGDITSFGADMGTTTASLDFGIGAAHFGPFANFVLIRSSDFASNDVSFTGGLFFYVRLGKGGKIGNVPR